jgi:hypothetical protein
VILHSSRSSGLLHCYLTFLQVVITGPSGEVPHRLTDNHDGTYLVQYHIEPSAKGDYKFQVTVNGHDILGTPFVVSY